MRQTPSQHRISDRKPATVGRHRRSVDRVWRPTRETLRLAVRSRAAVATSALTCLALATLAGQPASGSNSAPATVSAASMGNVGSAGRGGLADVIDTFDTLGRTSDREASVLEAMTGEPAPAADEDAAAAEVMAAPVDPTPVAGLDQIQMNNAWKIVQTGQSLGLSRRAFIIAVATAMQESQLRNLASTRIPESYQYNAEGQGSDHDSVGLFQQRPSAGWGRVSELMDPHYAASAFYSALLRVSGWESMELTWAAQRVQVSAFPYAYAKHEPRATEIVDALLAHAAPAP